MEKVVIASPNLLIGKLVNETFTNQDGFNCLLRHEQIEYKNNEELLELASRRGINAYVDTVFTLTVGTKRYIITDGKEISDIFANSDDVRALPIDKRRVFLNAQITTMYSSHCSTFNEQIYSGVLMKDSSKGFLASNHSPRKVDNVDLYSYAESYVSRFVQEIHEHYTSTYSFNDLSKFELMELCASLTKSVEDLSEQLQAEYEYQREQDEYEYEQGLYE